MDEKRKREEVFSRILLRGAATCALLICGLFLMVVVTGCGTKKNQPQEEHTETEPVTQKEEYTQTEPIIQEEQHTQTESIKQQEPVADETDYSGIYTDTQGTDDIYSELEVKKQSDGSYLFSMGLYRLTTIEGTAKQNGNVLDFNGTDASGNPIEGYITIIEEKAVATFTNSTWAYIKNGDVFEFPSGKMKKTALEPWQEAYIQYLQQDSDVAGQDGYTLINMSKNENPLLVEVGNCEASGCRIVYFVDGKVHVTQLGRLNFTYIPNENLLCNSDGNMDTYYDLVYSMIDGEITLIAQGYYGSKDNSNVQFDSKGNPIYQYEWNGVEMSKEEYGEELNRIYDTTKAVGYDNLYSVEEVIEMVEEYQK